MRGTAATARNGTKIVMLLLPNHRSARAGMAGAWSRGKMLPNRTTMAAIMA